MIRTDDKEAVPLLAVTCLRALDGRANVHSPLIEVLRHLLALLLNQGHRVLLLHHKRLHVLEQLRQLNHLRLDLLDRRVAVLHVGERLARLPAAIALEQGLAEDLLVGILDRIAHLGLGRIGADNPVLAGHLRLQLLAEVALDVLVLVDGGLELAVHLAELRRVLGAAGLGLLLDRLDARCEAAVHGHRLAAHRVELGVGRALLARIRVVERALLEHADRLQVALDGVDAFVNLAALVQDGVGVLLAAELLAVLGQGLQFDVLAWAGLLGCIRSCFFNASFAHHHSYHGLRFLRSGCFHCILHCCNHHPKGQCPAGHMGSTHRHSCRSEVSTMRRYIAR